MSLARRKQAIAVGLALAVLLAVGAWIAGGQIRSPAQIAAETAAPTASPITVPVERRELSSEVVVRGTVRYGSPQPVVLATSTVKQGGSGGGGGGSDIVTRRPRTGATIGEGTEVMSVSGRPVFALRGAQPTHRDIGPGSRGPDVRQLEEALTRMGFSAGRVDGSYDGATAAAVARWYEKSGNAPFGPTDAQREQLRLAEATASQARDTHLKARVDIQTAAQGGATPGDVAQARIDLETARDAVDTASLGVRTAQNKARTTADLARRTAPLTLAVQNAQKESATAAAEVDLRRGTLNRALVTYAEAQRALAAPPDPAAVSPPDPAALQAAAQQAAEDVAIARAELNKALTAALAAPAAGRDAISKAQADRRLAIDEARTAAADLVRARQALPTARRQVLLAARRLAVLRSPDDTTLQQLLAQSASREARGTSREVARLARNMGIKVPADEVLFFPTVPLRVDSVGVKRGDSASGTRVMTVSNSRLSVDSSLSVNDAKLVRAGASVLLEETDLGVRTGGVVSEVADRPGTQKVDPSRVYLEVTPRTAPAQLVGASVKLTIAVKSTGKRVLVVPTTALSVGADGEERVQVQGPGGRTSYVGVTPGLAAKGLVEVQPVRGRLAGGDLVVVGANTARRVASAPRGAPAQSASRTP